ncbi:MAG: T9SS type A sorting domain-containing protein [Brumimicrobium sp.]
MKATTLNSKTMSKLQKKLSKFIIYVLLISLSILSFNQQVHSQITPSSCTAPTNILEGYHFDVVQFDLRKIFQDNLPEKDSIEVPPIYGDTILDALIAVYNIDTPERDTVIDIYNIHTFPTISTGNFGASVNSQLIQNLNELDSLMNKYNITHEYRQSFGDYYIDFGVSKKYNQPALINALVSIPGIYSPYINEDRTNENDIKSTIYNNHVELLYSYAWGDCPMGCVYERFWKFKIYYDCSAEFIESYGDTNPPLNIEEESEFESLSFYPNPATNTLNFTLNDNSSSLKLDIYDVSGKKVKSENYSNQENGEFSNSVDISELKNGLYFCKFSSGQGEVIQKFIKH